MGSGDRCRGHRPVPRVCDRPDRTDSTRRSSLITSTRSGWRTRAIDDARRRVQQESLGRGRRDDPLYRIRRRLLVGHERLSDQQHDRLLMMLGHGDRHGDVTNTYLAKELLRDVYNARTVRAARRRLRLFYEALRPDRRARVSTPRPHYPGLGSRGARVPYDRPFERADRRDQRVDQEGQTRRARLPQLQQLPATTPVALRRYLALCPHRKSARQPRFIA
jgi:hypothetical protein